MYRDTGRRLPLPYQTGERVELVAEQIEPGEAGAELRPFLGRELVVIGVTMGGGKLLLRHEGATLFARGGQVRRRPR